MIRENHSPDLFRLANAGSNRNERPREGKGGGGLRTEKRARRRSPRFPETAETKTVGRESLTGRIPAH